MKPRIAVLSIAAAASANAAFVPSCSAPSSRTAASWKKASTLVLRGYLDDLSKELYKKGPADYDPETDSREANEMNREDIDRYGPGKWENYVDFDEFDGGDGQMGVAGDGDKGLEKIGSQPTLAKSLSKSKMMSAKNAWGTSTGYADELLKKDPKMDSARAQQIENWRNQREVYQRNQWVKEMEVADSTQKENAETDWRQLAKFGVERNQEFDLDEAFGAVSASDALEEIIEIKSLLNRVTVHELPVKNEFMGFADFRAAFTSDSSPDFKVEPREGALSKDATNFIVKFKPNSLGVSEAHLVIETEDFKKTWKFIGSTA